MKLKRVAFVLFVVFLAIVAAQDAYVSHLRNHKVEPRNYTVILSLDGFRFDYQDIASTPTFDSIERAGVRAAGLQTVFPSLTFTNHYTIATGLYAENHGIVANKFMVPQTKQCYSNGKVKSVVADKLYGGEPIWVTAESQRIKSAVNMWVGCDAQIKGYRPTTWKPYSASEPYKARIDSVIKWLSADYDKRPHLAMCYIEAADTIGHKFGPDSPEIVEAIQEVDSLVGYFCQQLSTLSFCDSINFIILSDHGMIQTDAQNVVDLKKYVRDSWVDTLIYSPAISLAYCKKHCADSVVSALQGVDGVTACLRADLPERFHCSASARMGDVVILSDSGKMQIYKGKRPLPLGAHGYDNANRLMNGIFYAIGPDFKQDFAAPQLYNTDVYGLLCRLLEIAPAHSNGQIERIECVLKE